MQTYVHHLQLQCQQSYTLHRGTQYWLAYDLLAFWNISTQKLNRSTKGSGPEARPPKVFSLAPAGRTLLTCPTAVSYQRTA